MDYQNVLIIQNHNDVAAYNNQFFKPMTFYTRNILRFELSDMQVCKTDFILMQLCNNPCIDEKITGNIIITQVNPYRQIYFAAHSDVMKFSKVQRTVSRFLIHI